MNSKSPITMLAMILLVIGGLNWGLVGLMDIDLVATLFGDMTVVSRVVYTLVGLSAVYAAVTMLMKGEKSSPTAKV